MGGTKSDRRVIFIKFAVDLYIMYSQSSYDKTLSIFEYLMIWQSNITIENGMVGFLKVICGRRGGRSNMGGGINCLVGVVSFCQ